MRYFKIKQCFFEIEESEIVKLAKLGGFSDFRRCDACKKADIVNIQCGSCESYSVDFELIDEKGWIYIFSGVGDQVEDCKPEDIYLDPDGRRFDPQQLEFDVESVLWSDGANLHLTIIKSEYETCDFEEIEKGSEELPDFKRTDDPKKVKDMFALSEKIYSDGWKFTEWKAPAFPESWWERVD